MGYAIDGVQATGDAAELNLIDGSIAGTQVAGKAVIADSNVNIGATLVTSIGVGTSGSEVTQEVQLAAPTLATIDSAAQYDVGRVYRNAIGAEWVYIQGVASTIAGNWLSFVITSTAAATTVRAIANAVGTVGVAVGALVNTKFGWVQVYSLNLGAGAISGGDAAAGAAVYLTGTAGLCDDQFVDGDLVHGAVFVVQEGALAGTPAALAGVWLNHPYIDDIAYVVV